MMNSTKETYSRFFYILLLFFAIFFWQRCAPVVYSPHAQNEMIAPYNRHGETHELGAASAINAWMVSKEEGTMYLRTYPAVSLSLFHNASVAKGKFGGIGGVELIGFPSTALISGAPGTIFALKPYAGLQYGGSIFSLRLNLTPFTLVAGIADGEWAAGGDLNELTFYQLTMLLHNQYPSKNIYWGGARLSPAAAGLAGGYEYSFDERHLLRAEYSALVRPPFSLFYSQEELESLKGWVHYMTFGLFMRLK